ncbi:MAG: tRNA 2-thiouridine(34) synthase MnmA [Candidatus Omnitrophota bacterium]|nr:MAG: tRNA 2-thiouridine(34) synthase MnmA [Candidatus Omnitrophota bacterium]
MEKIAVGLSGGIDSSVAACLLKEKGYEIEGIFMKIWDGKQPKPACCGDVEKVKEVADILEIPLHIIDLRKEYEEIVIEYFKNEYMKGRTPNPCVICNRFLKFGVLLDKISEKKIYFDYFATGHYARIGFEKGRYILKKGKDPDKDQSYFLYLLNQKQLSKLIFPLGDYKKEKVKEIAKMYKLPVSDREESQDFISPDKFFFFDIGKREGEIVDKYGNVLGKHKGIIYYTVGQRRGLGIAMGKPYYVIGIDGKNNRIIVGEEKELFKKEFIVKNINLISVDKIEKPVRADVKIRYKHPPSPATIIPFEKDSLKVIFDYPQRAITPGQSAVFYQEDIVLGGGIIEKVL